MPLTATDYRQFAHDTLNMIGRLQSIVELADIADEDLRRILERDIDNLTRAVKLFSKLGWCQQQKQVDKTEIDASSLLIEVITAERPEGLLLAVDENIKAKADPVLLRAIFSELVHNIAQHGNLLEPSKVTLRQTSKGPVLEVENHIAGTIPATPHETYVKGEKSHGLGLGLPMVYAAAQAMDMPFDFVTTGEKAVATLKLA